jgi:hypothetical protein
MRIIIQRILMVAAVASATASCGDVVRSGRSPMFLSIDSLTAASAPSTTMTSTIASDVITTVTSPAPCTTEVPCLTIFSDPGAALLRVVPKDISTSPSTNNDVTITRVHVQYRRADGRNVQGVDVPYAFDGAATVTVPANGSATIGFTLVRNAAKAESPLIQLQVNGSIITTIADVTFYGRDRVGNDISVTGSIQIDFGNFGN